MTDSELEDHNRKTWAEMARLMRSDLYADVLQMIGLAYRPTRYGPQIISSRWDETQNAMQNFRL